MLSNGQWLVTWTNQLYSIRITIIANCLINISNRHKYHKYVRIPKSSSQLQMLLKSALKPKHFPKMSKTSSDALSGSQPLVLHSKDAMHLKWLAWNGFRNWYFPTISLYNLNTSIHNRVKMIILISKLRLLDTALSSQLCVIGLADKQTLIFLHYSDAGMFAVP